MARQVRKKGAGGLYTGRSSSAWSVTVVVHVSLCLSLASGRGFRGDNEWTTLFTLASGLFRFGLPCHVAAEAVPVPSQAYLYRSASPSGSVQHDHRAERKGGGEQEEGHREALAVEWTVGEFVPLPHIHSYCFCGGGVVLLPGWTPAALQRTDWRRMAWTCPI